MEADWQQSALPVLDALGQALQELGRRGLQPDDLRFSLFPPGAVATITEERLNAYIGDYDALAGLRVDLVGEEEAFVLSGSSPTCRWRSAAASWCCPTASCGSSPR